MMITMMVNRVMIKVIVVCSDYVNLGKKWQENTYETFILHSAVCIHDGCMHYLVCLWIFSEDISAETWRPITEPYPVCWRCSICQWSDCVMYLQLTVQCHCVTWQTASSSLLISEVHCCWLLSKWLISITVRPQSKLGWLNLPHSTVLHRNAFVTRSLYLYVK